MPHEEQNEWPSFETVLRDVAPDSPKARLLASAADRARYSASAESVRASAVDTSNDTPSLAPTPIEPHDDVAVEVPLAYTALPAPLEPLEIDTSEVRALLEHRTEPIPEGDTLSALAELAPWPELEVEAPSTVVSETVVSDHNQPEPLEDHNDLFALVEDDNEPELLEDHNDLFALVEDTIVDNDADDVPIDDSLVFELDDVLIEEVDAAYEATVADQPAPLDDPFIDAAPLSIADVPDSVSSEHDSPIESIDDALGSDPFGLDPFSSVGAGLDAFPVVDNSFDGVSIDLSADELPHELDIAVEAEGIELPGQISPPIEVFEDLAPIEFIGDQFEATEEVDLGPELLDMSGLDHSTEGDDFFESPGMDLFDLNIDSDTIETERIDIHGEELYANDDEFDSIAAADQIETDLDELIGLKSNLEPNNVIPLHSGIDLPTGDAHTNDQPAEVKNLSAESANTGWVELAPAPPEADEPDPWEHMRPVEEPKKVGFWANRPKFFGGDDRKRRKAERRSEDAPTLEQAVDVTFEKECPNCAADCNVELDDPIGRRVHLTCPSCQHIWYTPYILEESRAG